MRSPSRSFSSGRGDVAPSLAAMAQEYRAPRTVNRIVMWLNRLGLGPAQTLETIGRKTGATRAVPITPIHVAGEEYLVAPYGEVSWVHNVRSRPAATLCKGGDRRRVELVEVTTCSPHVVKAYWDRTPIARRYMDVPGEATTEDFASVTGRFPVFRVEETG